ncbi:Ig-like domain-containing protein [Thalassotalea sp. 1_MG-2023]|uniref:Ig-like domain-containing protein n=1 Tax=Thalassotalea sp. 1_MG-2023 TaxID=3062680 RepID=UPI0026E2610D|nr:Ig-like domain-containing protein [Thalassotalea sp. 1_MG-2023]MDO6426697.1 Ig-like domain-containing protein [Thalassotalea sp. 1_MG-2023]
MNKINVYRLKLFALSLVVMNLSACFNSDNDDKVVIEPNVPPVAGDANLATQTETNIVDNLPVSDANGDTLTFEISSEPQLGTVGVSSDGTFTYIPFAEQTGSDSFTYTVSDGIASPVSGTINITIEALQVSFTQFSRDAFNQASTDIPLSINGREFIQDVANQSDYQDLIDAN